MGEPMALLMAEQTGALAQVDNYHLAVAGAEYNVAVGLARLGHTPEYITRLGDDPFGKRIVSGMNANGIGTELVEWDEEHSTGMMLKGKAAGGEDPDIFYFRKNSAASAMTAASVPAIKAGKYDALHLTGIFPALNEGTFKAVVSLLRSVRAEGLPVFFDPNLRPSLWPDEETMRHALMELATAADYVLPGIGEGRILTGFDTPEEIAEAFHRKGVRNVIIKLGPSGAYYSAERQSGMVAGFQAEKVVDTVGAGDGFAVGVVSGILEGLPLEEAVRRGNAIGCIQVMHRGDNEGLPDRETLTRFMSAES